MSPEEPWSANHDMLPDFLIVGAMKSGTTSLHRLLENHPDIFMPPGELFFFCLDDIEQMPDSFVHTGQEWTFHDLDQNFDEYLDWYLDHFSAADTSQVIGEDSTTYLPSRKAPERISKLLPNAKLLVLLRDPVNRAYSHYWHLVRKGNALFDFETTIERAPGRILNRSMYREAIERYYRYFDREQMKFIVFEDFIQRPEEVARNVFDFLGVPDSVKLSTDQTHRNQGKAPHFPTLKRAMNLFFRRRIDQFDTRATFRNRPGSHSWLGSQLRRGLHGVASMAVRNRAVAKLERMVGRDRYPPMQPETREFLEKLFWKENRGLSDLIGIEVSNYWEYFD